MQSSRRRFLSAFLVAALAVCAEAQTTWVGGSGNNFSTAGNWNNATAPSNNGLAALTFGTTGFSSVTVDIDFSISSLTFNGATGYSFSGSNTLSIASAISASASSLTMFSNPLALTAASTFTNSGTAGLAVSAINLGANNLTLSPSSGLASITVNGNVTGGGALRASGTGTTFLNGSGNTYGGGTTVDSGSTLQVGNGTAGGSLPGNVANSGTVIFNPSGSNLTYAGVISGTGSNNKFGANTLTLSGANTYSGGTNVSGGTLADGATGSFSANSGISMTGGATATTLSVNFNESIKGLGGSTSSANATVSLASGTTLTLLNSNLTYNGTISGAGGAITVSGTGGNNQALTGSSSYTGVTKVTGGGTLSAGVLADIGSNSSIGTGDASSAATNAASLVLDSSSVLAYTGTTNVSTDRLFTLGSGGAKIFVNNSGTLNFTNSGAIAFSTPNVSMSLVLGGSSTTTNTFNPSLGNNGSATVGLIKGSSPDTWVLTGANTYTGQTQVQQGTLRLGADSTLPSSAFVNLSSGATLDIAGNQTINNFSGTGSGSFVTLQSGKTLTVNPVTTGFTSTTYDGTISGSGNLTVNGTGNFFAGTASRLKITGNTTNFTGATTVIGGSLEITSGVTSGSAITVNGGVLVGDGGSSTTNTLTVNNGGAFATAATFAAGATTFNNGSTFAWNLADTALTPANSGYGQLTVNGALTLSGLMTLKVATFFGAAANFDTTQTYVWNLTTGATSLTGFDANNVTIDTSLFSNQFTGAFGVSAPGNNLVLTYTGGSPIPEPAAFAVSAGALALMGALVRRRKTLRA